MNKVMSNKLLIALYISPALLLVLVLVFIPLILSGYYGLMEWDGIGDKTFIGLENYINGLQDMKFWSIMRPFKKYQRKRERKNWKNY